MRCKILYGFSIFIILSFMHCNPFKEKSAAGALQIEIVRETDNASLPKKLATLHHLQCIIKLENTIIHSRTYYQEGGFFQIIIRNLQPSDDYSVLLWGYNEGKDLVGQGISDNVAVKPDDITTVTIEWKSFYLRLYSPANNAVIKEPKPRFSWSNNENAQSFQLEIDSIITYSSGAHQLISTENSSFQVDSLFDAPYFWRVRCLDERNNWTSWSSSFQFTLDTQGPIPPELLFPEMGDTVNTSGNNFTWTEVLDAMCYDLEICENELFINSNIYISSIYYPNMNYLGYATRLSDGLYYWRVCSKDSLYNRGKWSEVSYFIIDTEGSAAPLLLSPADGDTVKTASPLFDWSDVHDASPYSLEMTQRYYSLIP